MGLWHQIATYYSTNGQGTCNRAEYTLLGNVVQVMNSQIVNLTLDAVAGNATVVSNDGSARLSVVLEVAPGGKCLVCLFLLTSRCIPYLAR